MFDDDKYADNLKQLIELGIQFRVDLNVVCENSKQPTPSLAHDVSAAKIETIANFLNKHELPKNQFKFDFGNGSTALVGGADLAEWTYDPELESWHIRRQYSR
ncbi:hypothetical protein O9993_07050 [Vibrio lentus]|nr:hypothetical protein [Vibrio lentus]